MEDRIITESGKLYVIATPIGNLEDISYRAIRTLSEVDLVLCEDTRRTVKLMNHYEIKKPLQSYHSYNEDRVSDKLIERLRNGDNLALVSDGGTPCISDPGFHLVSKAVEEGFDVVPIPGASAVTAVMSVSGFPLKEFIFTGFLPKKKLNV